jgi:hypothetical protein
MMRVYRFDAILSFSFYVLDTWMCLERGEGEKEIANHGWSGVKSFSQETEAIGQQRSRSDRYEPKLYSKNRVQDAHDSPTQLPFFSFSNSAVVNATTDLKREFSETLLFGQSSLVFDACQDVFFLARRFLSFFRNSSSLWNLIRVSENSLFRSVVDQLSVGEGKLLGVRVCSGFAFANSGGLCG